MLAGRLLFYGPSRDLLPYFGETELSALFHQFEQPSSHEVRAVADRAAADFERTPLFRQLIGQRLD